MRVGGRGARLSPFRAPGPCFAFAHIPALLAPTAPAAGNGGVDVIPRSPRPGPRPGGQRPGGAAAGLVDSLSVHSPSARTPRRERTGWKGVCEPGTFAHTLAVTHKAVVS